jgi:hypothetical protein
MYLTGDKYTEENPVNYEVDGVIGPDLMISVKDSDVTRY